MRYINGICKAYNPADNNQTQDIQSKPSLESQPSAIRDQIPSLPSSPYIQENKVSVYFLQIKLSLIPQPTYTCN